ncbi:MAG TPA: histidine kinase dimerization/phospho-acceptor domain-containing protein [Longimicrobium sp.]|nr:histidine kinase dimerization/phospho-acceptor domain-containing protein [Longimicrobium sp.]
MTAPLPPPGEAVRHALPASLIHDLRTPLGQIIGYAEMLAEQAQEEGDGGPAADLNKIGAAGYRILELIEAHFEAAPDLPGEPAPSANGRGHAVQRPAAVAPPAGQAVRLADFIAANREPILAEWEAFARTCTPASGAMDIVALRDHAGEMLRVIVADLRTPQGAGAQAEKAKGHAPDDQADAPTAAEEHGAGRAESGFTVEQMVSEYRALRASVIRLWSAARGELGPADLDELTRFNEAIDQSLAESISRYTEDLDHSKEMFLAILGHDLRTPLGAVSTSAKFMLDTQELEEPTRTLTARIASSSARMIRMVGDLLDFTRSRLGGGIPIVRGDMSMAKVVHDVADELAAAHPGRTLQVDTRGAQRGEWDVARITQALANLVGNALEHGAPGTVVRVDVQGNDDEITVAVCNRGAAIPASQLNGIFNPMKPRDPVAGAAASGPAGNLGLGLYIAERIVNAHQGRIDVESSEEHGTTFTVHLPRHG